MNRSTSEATGSLLQALRGLFRRTPRPQVEAEVVLLPAGLTAQRPERQGTDRPKAA